MKKVLRPSIILSAVIVFSASSFAQPLRGMKRGRGLAMRSPARMLWVLKAKQKELNITDIQIEKIQSLVFSFEEKMIQMRSQRDTERLNLRKLMQEREKLDYEKIKATLSKMSSSRQDMFIQRLKLIEEIQNILTPEQREAMQEAVKEGKFFQRGERMQRLPRWRDRIKR